jgi:UDP-2,3-diacylglucosamine pyrophosphatase LpxH
MVCIEESEDLQAKGYSRTLSYTVDRSLADQSWPFRYVFEGGELRCSEAAKHSHRICYVPREVETVLANSRPSFIYLDVGCWVDDSDGEGTRRRDFGLVCGQHVYLCEYVGKPVVPATRVPAVKDFFTGLACLGCGARVVRYARARDFNRKTWQDPNLYLLLGDLHLPPLTWFYSRSDFISPPERELPAWLANAPAMARQPDRTMRSGYECAAFHRARGDVPSARTFDDDGDPDISQHAGDSLARFLRALASLDPGVRRNLHFIHLGDLFELWVGRKYHLVPGPDGMPRWRYPESPDIVANWCLEVMIQNAPVFSALKRLEGAGLAEVKYLAGNHDGYLLQPGLAAQLGLPPRAPFYRGLSGDLLAEHGHRFDSSNFDNVNGQKLLSGPGVTRVLLLKPSLRKLEGRLGKMMYWKPEQRDLHLLGATLLFLDERFELQQKPFSIYAMGHSHARMLARFDLRAQYSNTGG